MKALGRVAGVAPIGFLTISLDPIDVGNIEQWHGRVVVISDADQSLTPVTQPAANYDGMQAHELLTVARQWVVRAITATALQHGRSSQVQTLGHILTGIDQAIDRDLEYQASQGGDDDL